MRSSLILLLYNGSQQVDTRFSCISNYRCPSTMFSKVENVDLFMMFIVEKYVLTIYRQYTFILQKPSTIFHGCGHLHNTLRAFLHRINKRIFFNCHLCEYFDTMEFQE